jgi:hypothetical protein
VVYLVAFGATSKRGIHLLHYSDDFELLNDQKIYTSNFDLLTPLWDNNNGLCVFGRNDDGGKKYFYDAVEKKFIEEDLEWDTNGAILMNNYSPYDKGWIACSQVFNPMVYMGLKRSKKVEGINIFDVVNNKVTIIPINVDGYEPQKTYCGALTYMKKSNVIVAQVFAKEEDENHFSQHILIYDTNGDLLADHQYELEEGVVILTTEIIEKSNMEFYMMGMSETRFNNEFSMYKIHFTDKTIGELEMDDATAIFDQSCKGETTAKGNRNSNSDDPALSKYSMHDPLYVKDGFYLIVEKAMPIEVMYSDPKTGVTSLKTRGYNYDFAYVLKYDLDANLQWKNCLEFTLDHSPWSFLDLVCVATDPLPNVKLGYLGIASLTTKAFDASGEVVKSVSSVDLFTKKYLLDSFEHKQENSRLYYLKGNTFLGCHMMQGEIELKKYEFE